MPITKLTTRKQKEIKLVQELVALKGPFSEAFAKDSSTIQNNIATGRSFLQGTKFHKENIELRNEIDRLVALSRAEAIRIGKQEYTVLKDVYKFMMEQALKETPNAYDIEQYVIGQIGRFEVIKIKLGLGSSLPINDQLYLLSLIDSRSKPQD